MLQKIMIVDDEEDIVTMIQRYFTLSGYDVITANGGKEALDKMELEPDIIAA